MRIAIVTHCVAKGDGQGRVNYEIAWASLHRGHDLVVLSSEIDDSLRSHPAVDWIPVSVEHYPTVLLRNQVFAWHTCQWLRSNAEAVDCLLANGCITWATADINIVHFVHSAWLRSPYHSSKFDSGLKAWYQRLYTAINAIWERFSFRQAETIVAVSEQIRHELISIGVPRSKIQVITNGVDAEEFSPGSAPRSAFSLPADVPLAIFVGDIQRPLKNLDTVLYALQRTPKVHLAIAGNAEGSSYPPLTTKLGLEDRVHFLGYCKDIPQLMRTADLFVLPSRYESFSLALLEAMASGLPVVTSAQVGASHLVTPNSGVVLNDPNDQEALSSVLNTLIKDSDLRRQMGASARRVAEQHSFENMAQQYMEVIERTTAGSVAD